MVVNKPWISPTKIIEPKEQKSKDLFYLKSE